VALLAAVGLVSACSGSDKGTDDDTDVTGDEGGGVGGDGADGSDGSDGSDGTDGGDGVPGCEDAEEIVDEAGEPTGYERCSDGSVNRRSFVAPSAVIERDRCEGTEDYLSCETDLDCNDGPHGACLHYPDDFGGGTACGCVYACDADTDCDTGEICLAAGIVEGNSWSTCVQADCTVNTDCVSGECGVSSYNDGCGYQQTATCRDPDEDACRVDDECDDQCGVYYSSTTWECLTMDCAIGRPMVDEQTGAARTAPVVERGDWRAQIDRLTLPENGPARQIFAAHWTAVARMEHASVASFARFTLELMALGAPPELVLEAQRAAADEVDHATVAFAIASAAAGSPVGPGAFDMGGAAPATTRDAALVALIREACVGETVGVAEARDAAERCTEPTLRAALLKIATDEQRHAALAWKTLKWLLEGADEQRRQRARDAFAEAIASVEQVEDAPIPAALDAWGMPSVADRRALRRRAVEAVVRPCMEAVLASAPAPQVFA
jgi:hypothetical protein